MAGRRREPTGRLSGLARSVLVVMIACGIAFVYSDRLRPYVRQLQSLWKGDDVPSVTQALWVKACAGRRFLHSSECHDICIEQAQLSVRHRKPDEQMQKRATCHRCPSSWFKGLSKQYSHADPIWAAIHDHQGDEPWGSVLDAGTGTGSLKFISQLNTTSWSAVTASLDMHTKLTNSFHDKIRDNDQLLLMNWDSPDHPLKGRTFDVVLADYLVGAMDGFSPYQQDQIFEWLSLYTTKRLYFVGKEPIPDKNFEFNGFKSTAGQLFLDSERLRDACLLMAGDRPYREYPSEWVLRALKRAHFTVERVWMFPIRYAAEALEEQLQLCKRRSFKIRDPTLRAATLEAVENLMDRISSNPEAQAGFCFGMDYVIAARPPSPQP